LLETNVRQRNVVALFTHAADSNPEYFAAARELRETAQVRLRHAAAKYLAIENVGREWCAIELPNEQFAAFFTFELVARIQVLPALQERDVCL
jgi:hypothetical protein